jgi:aspartokinase-like uncharacterized kinase
VIKVVKLGGSLNRDPLLRKWLQLLAGAGAHRVVIVPGGGGFADQVREHQAQWHFDDLSAHNMAVLAMMQSAILLQSLVPGLRTAATVAEIDRVLQAGEVAVWSPVEWLRQQADDMTHWGATSDSLAAWLAGQLGAARLVLVKSCTVPPGVGVAQHVQNGLLDADFGRVTANAGYTIDLLGKMELARMQDLLAAPAGAGNR